MKVYLTRRYRFQSVHALHVGEHREVKHGHHFDLEVSVKGQTDVRQLDHQVQTCVLDRLHAKDLNDIIQPATGEILVDWIHAQLRKQIPSLRGVALQETRKNRFVSALSEVCFV